MSNKFFTEEGFMPSREEGMFVDEANKVYLLTGQSIPGSDRKAFIKVLPFGEATEAVKDMFNLKSAQQISPTSSEEIVVEIAHGGRELVVTDTYTGTQTVYDHQLKEASYKSVAKGIQSIKARIDARPNQVKPLGKYGVK